MDHSALEKFPPARPPILSLSTSLVSQKMRLHKPLTVPWYPPGPDSWSEMPEPSDQVYIFWAQNGSTATNSSIPPDFPFQIDDIPSHVSLGMVPYIIFGPWQAVRPDY